MVPCTCGPDDPILPRFYAGRDVFITGASGFMGKVLVERLLSTCPDIGQVFLLMRDKRGQPSDKRLAQLKQSQVFDNLRARSPGQLDKLIGLAGDVSLPFLGLDADAITQLRKVSIVFHNAATVKFWEPLDVAISQNLTSVIHLMDLCDKLSCLEAMVHVSTAFTNAELRHIEERVYPAPVKLQSVQALLEGLPSEVLQDITPKYIYPKPNTYVFTKALAEVAVDQRQGRNYSVAIFRPSIVVSSHRMPVPGWIEGLSGACGVVVGTGQGLLRVFNINMDARAEMIPVDIAIDNLIAVAWETATDKLKEPRVYYCGSQENRITWKQFKSWLMHLIVEYPQENVVYYPYTFSIRNKYVYKVLEVLLQTVPLHTAEYISTICGIKTPISLIKASQRLREMTRVLRFFSCQEWTFSVDNLRRVRKRLQDTDGHIYHLDVNDVNWLWKETYVNSKPTTGGTRKIVQSLGGLKDSFVSKAKTHLNWEEHTRNFVLGARKYVLQQKDDTLPLARKRIEMLRVVHHCVILLIALVCYQFLQYIVPIIFRLIMT